MVKVDNCTTYLGEDELVVDSYTVDVIEVKVSTRCERIMDFGTRSYGSEKYTHESNWKEGQLTEQCEKQRWLRRLPSQG
jgi:hypothetical protein